MKFIIYKGVHWNIAQIVDIQPVKADKNKENWYFAISFSDGSTIKIENNDNYMECTEIYSSVLNFCMTVGGSNVLEIL